MRDISVQGSETALAVLMFTSLAGTERDRTVRINDPIGPRLFRKDDGKYRVGRMPKLHPLFRRMLERSDPGMYGFLVARLLHMDDVVRQEAADGLDQLVILGAGYDTRAYRMRDQLADVNLFEVDLPVMSRDKQSRLKKALGSVPEDVNYVEVDFNQQNLFEQLSEHGYEDAVRTLFVLSGVSMYLPEMAVLELFSQVAKHSAEGSSIIFDYVFDDVLIYPEQYSGARKWIDRANSAGEELRYGIAMEEVGAVLASRGLQLASQHDMMELADRYLCRTDGSCVARPHEFVAIAHAIVVD